MELGNEITHRSATGRNHRGIEIHAAGGVHEHCLSLLQAKLAPGAKVLDAGAGSGALSARLQDAGFHVEAAELNPSDFQAGVDCHEWDMSDPECPIAPGTFDCVCAIEALEHVENPLQALRNLHALLKPGGLLVTSTPNTTHPRSRIKFLVRGEPSYFGPTEYYGTGHRTILTDWLLEQHVLQCGFVGVERSYAGRLGLTGIEDRLYRLMRPLLKLARAMPQPMIDDGAIVFVVARRPES